MQRTSLLRSRGPRHGNVEGLANEFREEFEASIPKFIQFTKECCVLLAIAVFGMCALCMLHSAYVNGWWG